MKIYLSAFSDEAAASLDEQAEALNKNNVGFTELRSLEGKNVSALTLKEAEEYSKRFSEKGIKIWSLGSPLAKTVILSDFEKQKAMAEHLCELADIFETDNIRAFSFIPVFRKADRRKTVDRVEALVKILSSHGKNYCLENDSLLYASTLDGTKDLLDTLPGLKFIYDPANFLMSGQDPDKTIPALLDRAYYLHIKDVTGKKIVPAGMGKGQISRIVTSLNRDITCTVEPHLFSFRSSKDPFCSQFDLKTKRGRFDCAVQSFRKLLTENGFEDKGTYFERI